MNEWESKSNISRMEMLSTMKIYPDNSFGKMKRYLKNKGGFMVCKFRTGQITVEAKIEKESKCGLCGAEEINKIHYLVDCPVAQGKKPTLVDGRLTIVLSSVIFHTVGKSSYV